LQSVSTARSSNQWTSGTDASAHWTWRHGRRPRQRR